jgi:hypothetical protein
MDAMALVSSDSEQFHFLAFSSLVRLLDPILDQLFHSFANKRKIINTIWDIKESNGKVVSSFEDIAEPGKFVFSELFKATPGCPIIEEILHIISIFPNSISEEMNASMKEDISNKKIVSTLSYFQKGKILGFDGLIVELYLGYYKLLKYDLLKVIQE